MLTRKNDNRGFSLFELLAVMMIMSILAAIAVPSYKRSQIKARETVLAEDLYQMRKAIDAFYADRNRYPDALEDLVDNSYLRTIPQDPFTRRVDSWECLPPQVTPSDDVAQGGCFDVRSGSDLIGVNGVPYQQW
ncbi:type II secretion system protein [uncultured Desulfuromonas sp.]|uniref:type IV pilin protein n=1 Tax=uncultured Desulfuromonas sp. TaxID=181013 RepID=UPI002AAB5021|nr:type II secretion system protein [uncultured Desulfuromonas sp.]